MDNKKRERKRLKREKIRAKHLEKTRALWEKVRNYIKVPVPPQL